MNKFILVLASSMFFTYGSLAMENPVLMENNVLTHRRTEQKPKLSIEDKDFIKGRDAFREEKYQEAFGYFVKAADREYHRAEHSIGLLYEFGLLGKEDDNEAERYYLLSKKHGNKHAEESIKRIYDRKSWWEKSFL